MWTERGEKRDGLDKAIRKGLFVCSESERKSVSISGQRSMRKGSKGRDDAWLLQWNVCRFRTRVVWIDKAGGRTDD